MSTVEIVLVNGEDRSTTTEERAGTADTALKVAIQVLEEYNIDDKGPYLIEDIKVDGTRLEVNE